MTERTCRIVVIGAGPAGISSAVAAREDGERDVLVVDDNPHPGGQIWRGEWNLPLDARDVIAREWLERFASCGAAFLDRTRIVAAPAPGVLLAENEHDALTIRYEKLILATGACERFAPFPGWTRPNVMGAGALQALVKGGLPIEDKCIVLAGSGPLLPAVAETLICKGARIACIVDQASISAVMKFCVRLLGKPGKLAQAARMRFNLLGTSYRLGWHPLRADGADGSQGDDGDAPLSSVVLTNGGGRLEEVPCDYLACGFHLTPRLELAELLGCQMEWMAHQCQRRVAVDEWQCSSADNVFCAGESAGIGGLDVALIEGMIAGYSAAGCEAQARKLFRRRNSWRRFADAMNNTFAPRPELRYLPHPGTIICRCEDVRYERIIDKISMRAAKLYTRCGMGACQGRICGDIVESLLDWEARSTRPPVQTARMETLGLNGNKLIPKKEMVQLLPHVEETEN